MAVMEGRARAAKRAFDQQISLAWHTAAFTAATQSKRGLKSLDAYLGTKPTKGTSPEDILAFFQAAQKSGASVNIRKLN